LRDFQGRLVEDEEGSEFPNSSAARSYAVEAMKEILAEAITHEAETSVEAAIVADEHGNHIAAVPVIAGVPDVLLSALTCPGAASPASRLQEYRRNADGCRRMAENTSDSDDKLSWLKLADAWLHMLPKHEPASSPSPPGWPEITEADSKASH
jgi:hypothetical protein